MGFYLNEGKYNLDSCYQFHKLEYSGYDSVKAIVDVIFPNGIKAQMHYKCNTMSAGKNNQYENYKVGNISFFNTDNNDLIKIFTDTVTIYWQDPQKFAGRYILEFQNMFDDKIGYRIVNTSQLHFNVTDFPDSKNGSFLLVTIYSEDNRKSSRIAILKK